MVKTQLSYDLIPLYICLLLSNIGAQLNPSIPIEFIPQTFHAGKITSIDIAPDGMLGATAGTDGAIKIWDIKKGILIRTISAHTGKCLRICFAENSSSIYSIGDDRLIKLWDAKSGKLNTSYAIGSTYRSPICFFPDCRKVAIGGNNNSVKIVSITDTMKVITLPASKVDKGYGSESGEIAISSNGKILATYSNSNHVRIWDLDNGTLIDELIIADRYTGSTESQRIWLSNNGNILVVKPPFMKPVIISLSMKNDLKNLIDSLHFDDNDFANFNFIESEDKIYIWGNDLTIRNTKTGKLISNYQSEPPLFVLPMASSFNTKIGIVASLMYNKFIIWPFQDGKEPFQFDITKGDAPLISSFSSDDQHLAIAYGNDNVRIVNFNSNDSMLFTLNLQGRRIDKVEYSLNNDFLACMGIGDTMVKIFKNNSFDTSFRDLIVSKSRLRNFQFNNNNTITLTTDSIIKVFDYISNKTVYTKSIVKSGWVLKFISKNDNSMLYTKNKFLGISNRNEFTDSIKTIYTDSTDIGIVINSPDSKTIAFTSKNDIIKILSTKNSVLLKEIHTLHDHINSITFTLNNQYLLSAGNDNTTRIWDLKDYKCIKTMFGHYNGINGVSISNTNKFFVTNGGDCFTNIWSFPEGNMLFGYYVSGKDELFYSPYGNCIVKGNGQRFIGLRQGSEYFDYSCISSESGILNPLNMFKIFNTNAIQTTFINSSNFKVSNDLSSQATLKTVTETVPSNEGKGPNTITSNFPKPLGDYGKKFAVVIGISDYLKLPAFGTTKNQLCDLRFSSSDASIFAKFLENDTVSGGNWNITKLVDSNATLEKVDAALSRVLNSSFQYDLIYIYFSGHGLSHPRYPEDVYLSMYDSDPASPISGFDYSKLRKYIARARCEHIILFVDACASGVIGFDGKGTMQSGIKVDELSFGLSNLGPNKVVIASSSGLQKSWEDPQKKQGVFTYWLLRGLQGDAPNLFSNGFVNLRELYEYVSKEVQEDTKEHFPSIQEPFLIEASGIRIDAFPLSIRKIR
jgi:WD40 repeat protein